MVSGSNGGGAARIRAVSLEERSRLVGNPVDDLSRIYAVKPALDVHREQTQHHLDSNLLQRLDDVICGGRVIVFTQLEAVRAPEAHE